MVGAIVTTIVGLAIKAYAAPLTIGLSMPDLSESFWTSLAYGVDDEAKKLGVTVVKLNAGGDGNVNQQISQLQDMAQRHVDAMIVGATSDVAIRPVVEQIIAAKIPVVGLSSLPNTPKLTAAVTADHYAMGKLQAECLGKAMMAAAKSG
jgi:ABC-type sugar transport system substrate-binding protein